MSDKLLVLLDDPESRAMIFAITHGGRPAGPARLLELTSPVPAEVLSSVAAYLGSDPAEVKRQLTALLPDLLDALRPDGSPLAADELARLMQADIMLDEDSAGAFG